MIIKTNIFEALTLLIILWNSLMLALQNEDFENSFTILYTIEMSLKILGLGFIFNKGAYLRDPWNILDFIIVVTSLLPFIIGAGTVNISFLRSFRILRPLRTISSIRNLRILLLTIFSSLPLLLETLMILFFFFLIFAIAGLQMFRGILKKRCIELSTGIEYNVQNYICGYQTCPTDYICGKMIQNPNWGFTNFDNIFYSFLNVFQCVTLEGWHEIMVYVGKAFHILASFYFVVLAFIGAFFLLNLTLAVIKLKFTQSQVEKKLNKKEIIKVMHKGDFMQLEDLRIYKAKERVFLKKFFEKTYDTKIYGANFSINAKTSPKMLEYFDFFSIIKNRSRRRSSITKLDAKLKNRKPTKKILKSNKTKTNNDSEHIGSLNIRGKRFKGFTNLPIINEEPSSSENRFADQSNNELIEELDSFIKYGVESNPLTSRDMPQSSPRDLVIPTNQLIQLKNKEDITKETEKLMKELDDNPEILINLELNSYRRSSRMSLRGNTPSKKRIKGSLSPLKRSDSQSKNIMLNTSLDSNKSLMEGNSVPISNRNSLMNLSPVNKKANKFSAFRFGSVSSSRNASIQNIEVKDKFIEKIPNKQSSLQSIDKIETKVSIHEKHKKRGSISDFYHIKKSVRHSKLNLLPTKKSFSKLMYAIQATNAMKPMDEIEKENKIYQEFEERRKEFYQRITMNVTQRVEADADNNYKDKYKEARAKFFKFGVIENIEFEISSYDDVLDKLIKKKSLEREMAEQQKLNSQKFKFSYTPLENLNFQSKKKNNKLSKKRTKKLSSSSTLIKETSLIPNFLPKRTNTISSMSAISYSKEKPSNVRVLPLSKSAFSRIAVMKRRKRVGGVQRVDSFKESMESSQTPGLKSKNRKKRNEDIDTSNYEVVKNKINEEIDNDHLKEVEEVLKHENKKIYKVVKEKDFIEAIVEFHNFSGLDVAPEKKHIWGVSHTNKMMKALNTYNQNSKIWLVGLEGILIVWHDRLLRFVNGSFFDALMNFCVITNTAILAMEGLSDDSDTEKMLDDFNLTFTYIFIIEMAIKIIALSPQGYVKEKLNIFDGAIVTISILELAYTNGGSSSISALRGVRILRTFRVLRVTRILRSLAFMKIIINVISKAISDFIYIALLLVLFIFIYSLFGMSLYSNKLDFKDKATRMNFDDFNNAFLTTFQLLTVENWQQLLHTLLRTNVGAIPTVLFLISWIFIGNYVFLNLFLTILLDGFTNEQEDNEDEEMSNQEYLQEPEIEKFLQLENLKEKENSDTECEEYDEEDLNLLRSFTEVSKAKTNIYNDVYSEESLFLFQKGNFIRVSCMRVARSNLFENLILTAIILSSLKLCIDTYLDDNDPDVHATSNDIDLVFTIFFILEAALKIISFGFYFDKGSYLRESWNQLDFFIVCSSIIDLAFDNVNLPVVKVLRLLRTLRPLRFISHNINLKIVVTALLESVSAIFNVTIVVFLIWLMFGILGINLLGKRMYKCEIDDYYRVSKTQCINKLNKNWISFQPNFSNIINAMISLFILSTQEGWNDIMLNVVDSNGDEGPIMDSNPFLAYYILAFILVGTFFLMNLFVGVIFYNFMKAQRSEQASLFLTSEQQHWIDIMKKIPNAKSDFMQIKPPDNKYRRILYNIVNKNKFETFILICIILNIISMAMEYEESAKDYSDSLEYINYIFTGIFIMEAVIKVFAYGIRGYWYNGWNRFDAFVVLTSIIDILMSQAGQSFLSFMKSGTQLARVFRVLRVSRLLKLVKSLEGLQRIIETLIITLPSLMNVGGLMMLVFFIYSVLGVYLFKDFPKAKSIDDWNNFDNFGNALILLFRCATGEDWFKVMFDLYKPSSEVCSKTGKCGSIFAPLYFLTFILLCTFIMLNLFILIIIQQFEERAESSTNLSEDYKEYLNEFKKIWAIYSIKSKGLKIHQKTLIDFMKLLPTPIGFEVSTPRYLIAKEVMKMNVQGDYEGYVYFNELLFAVMKRGLGQPILKKIRKENHILITKQEIIARKKLQKLNQKFQSKRTISSMEFITSSKDLTIENKKNLMVNPMFELLLLTMIFKSWSRFQRIIAEGVKIDSEFLRKFLEMDSSSDSEGVEEYSEDDDYSESELSDIEESNQDEYSEEEKEI